ncbi:hypothetical protein C7T94_13005 [Pedobacter yulinensis]|uniref:Lipoprotein n=1 Tax=Pedobacter yulinensis TaxID=2126353 RepID=A0A2T3HM11_9SPHI|nr:hypothetical protein [Pedobacter yulinensis]PST83475.1 hypothetical protein C7T94_13005 [Pedobacter yulinensis]
MISIKKIIPHKTLLLAGILLFTLACQVKKSDLLTLRFDSPLDALPGVDVKAKHVRDLGFGLLGYAIEKPAQYTLAGIALPAGGSESSAQGSQPALMAYAGGQDQAAYLGFKYISSDKQKSQEIITQLKKAYPRFREHESGGPQAAYSWDLPTGAWLFVFPGQIFDPNGKADQPVSFVVVKKNTRMANRNDPGMSTIRQYFETKFPEKQR